MATTYRPLANADQEHPLADPTVKRMRDAYRLEARAAHKSLDGRKRLCENMGWEEAVATEDPLAKDAYVVEMARLLFPTTSVGEGDDLNVAEVLRATSDFFAALS